MDEEMNTAAAMVEALGKSGVTHVFAYPGDPIIELMEQARSRGLEVVLAGREGTAGFMAEGFAAATGSVAVCMSTLGPGSTALVNGVAAANLDRVPMIAISGQIETSREQFFTHQVIDHNQLFSPITKWAGRVEAESVGTTMRKALRLATAERPGAVHLTIPSEVSRQTATASSIAAPPLGPALTTVSVNRTDASSDPSVLLGRARRPVLLAGIGAMRAGSTDALVGLAEKASIPVIVAPMSKGLFPEDHPLFAGVLDMACNQILWDFLAESDLIVAVGFDAVELIKPWNLSVPVLHIDATPNTDQIYAADCECVGDISAIVQWLCDEWSGQPRWTSEEVERHRVELRAAYYAGRVEGRLNPTDVIDVTRRAFPQNTIATTDVGSHKLLFGQGWQAFEPRSVLMTNGLSSMGFGVPAAIAASMAHPGRPVVALVGDGGFAMTVTEARLAAALRLPVVFMVFVDGSLNRIEIKQTIQGYPSTATRLEDLDLVGFAEGMGCDGVRVASAAELERALSNVDTLSRPLIVEAHIDPTQYESQF